MGDYVFPVLDNHPAMSRRYCELCGGEVDERGECASGSAESHHYEAHITAARKLTHWFYRLAMGVKNKNERDMITLLVFDEIFHHGYHGVRKMAEKMCLKKSQAQAHLKRLSNEVPYMAAVIGQTSVKSQSQTKRRRGEANGRNKNG